MKERIGSKGGSRGVYAMNQIEDEASAPIYIKNDKPISKELRDKDKAQALAKKYPGNTFYCGLAAWKKPYSEKQSNSIRTNYDKCFRIEKVIEEHNTTIIDLPVTISSTEQWNGENVPF